VPLGKLTVVDGDPGLGKSTLLLDLAARVSRHDTMPDGSRGRYGDVILLTAEDSLEDTVKPRLRAAGADLERIHSLRSVADAQGPRPPCFPEDTWQLDEQIRRYEAAMVVIDPFVAYLSTQLDTARDHHMRRALHLLGEVADRTGCAILLLRHLNKGAQNKAIYRGGGSIGIIAAARAGLLVAKDPVNEQQRVLLVSKSNLATPPQGLKYELVSHERTVKVAWRGLSFATPDGVLQTKGGEAAQSALEEAVQFLRELLTDKDYSYAEILKDAKACGINEHALRRAKIHLGVRSYKHGNQRSGATWLWTLKPKSETTSPENPSDKATQQDRAQANPGAWEDLLGSDE
jgi:RecA-family ATPase